ncbi:MAG: glycosyltransferase [Candidatus Paceibacterota bacterium]
MKIAIFTDSFFPYLCGITTAIKNRAEGLINRGHEVAVFRPSADEIESDIPEGLQVYDLPVSVSARGFKDLNIEIPLFLPAYNSVREFDPDIFHVDTEGGVGWQGVFSAKVMRKPLVTTPHTFWADEEYVEYLPTSNKSLKQSFAWKYMLSFHARADLVVTPSRAMKERFEQRELKTPMEVVPNSIREVNLKDDEFMKRKRDKYGLEGSPNLVFVGRVSHEKSLGKVIEAFKKVVPTYSDSEFVIIGDGDDRERLEEKVDKLDLEKKVKFLGSVPNDKLMKNNLYRLGDIFVTASKSEDFPVSLLEAQQFGLPIIAPEAGGIPEIVTDQKDGLLYSAKADEEVRTIATLLKELMGDKPKRNKMSQNALESSKRYSISRVSKRLEKLYQDLVA